MVRARLLVALVAAACLLGAVGTARSGTTAPTGLHAFLLRADEPARTSFSRTPAFAWAPVPGALHYEFQLSLSGAFRDNSVVYADLNVPTPVLAPDLTLPWITGNPHSLYARVRAVTPTGDTDWSASYGFDMVPPPPPTPMPSYPGVLRWTPMEGATAYEVWLVDAKKFEIVMTNVLDEREFYTFHEVPAWTGSIRWRIRVLRTDIGVDSRLNQIPAAKFGAWSTTYNSTNPAFAGGSLKLLGTVSDVYSDGSANSAAHRLMPAFLWSGNTGLSGQPSELFRVEIFTDKQCLNRVFTGTVTGAPAYAPRPFGPLALPTSGPGIVTARSSFLADGAEPAGVGVDGDPVTPTEAQPDTTPTGTAPGDPGSSSGSSTGGASSSSSSGTSGSTGAAPSAGATLAGGTVSWQGRAGAPIDLWDVDWPSSGYYWTVIPVSATPPDALSTAMIAPGAKVGDVTIPVGSSRGFNAGDLVQVGAGPTTETKTVVAVSDGQLTLSGALTFGHGSGESVTRVSGNFQYHDLELPQDACASGRVARFGKASEPSLTSSGDEFVTGLSADGRLTSARETTAFYGQPLISWTPALGATAYEVQWSKARYPFAPVSVNGAPGYVTTATSLVLPVGPGVWYYRVRGFDYSLPSGSQQMTWSDPARLVVAKPTFKIVTPAKRPSAPAPAKKTVPASGLRSVAGDGFTMSVPSSWQAKVLKDSLVTFEYVDAQQTASLNVLKGSGRAGRSYTQWAADLVKGYAASAHATAAVVTLPAGKAVLLTATGAVGGHVTHVLQYVVDAGGAAYNVTFVGRDGAYAADRALFGKMIASFKLG